VVVQANGDEITSRVRGAHIEIVDTATARVVGSAITGIRGVDLVRLTALVAPATLTVTARGGQTVSGVPFSSATWSSTSYRSPHAIFVEPKGTAAASSTAGAH